MSIDNFLFLKLHPKDVNGATRRHGSDFLVWTVTYDTIAPTRDGWWLWLDGVKFIN
jgi:hypothetical protein